MVVALVAGTAAGFGDLGDAELRTVVLHKQLPCPPASQKSARASRRLKTHPELPEPKGQLQGLINTKVFSVWFCHVQIHSTHTYIHCM